MQTPTKSTKAVPECLAGFDKERLQAMFAVLPSQEDDPERFNDQVEFWRDAFMKHLENTHSVGVSPQSFLEAMRMPDGLAPKCLQQVLQELTSRASLVDRDEYVSSLSSQSTARSLITTTLRWVLYPVTPTKKAQPQTLLICPARVQQEANKALQLVHNANLCTCPLLSVADLQLENTWSKETTTIVLEYLKNQNLAQTFIVNDCLFVKFASKSSTQVEAVSEVDKSVVGIKTTLAKLTHATEDLGKGETRLTKLALEQKKLNNTQRAIQFLKQRKMMQVVASKHSAAIHNLNTILLNIEQAQSSSEIVSALDQGAKTLSQLTESTPLSTIDNVLQDVEDALDDAREIDATLSQEIPNPVDDTEIEQELATLELEMLSISSPQDETPLPELPPVPTHPVTVPQSTNDTTQPEPVAS